MFLQYPKYTKPLGRVSRNFVGGLPTHVLAKSKSSPMLILETYMGTTVAIGLNKLRRGYFLTGEPAK